MLYIVWKAEQFCLNIKETGEETSNSVVLAQAEDLISWKSMSLTELWWGQDSEADQSLHVILNLATIAQFICF